MTARVWIVTRGWETQLLWERDSRIPSRNETNACKAQMRAHRHSLISRLLCRWSRSTILHVPQRYGTTASGRTVRSLMKIISYGKACLTMLSTERNNLDPEAREVKSTYSIFCILVILSLTCASLHPSRSCS
jgi:hypothetical protein